MVNTQNLYIRLLRLGLYGLQVPHVDLSHGQVMMTRLDDYVVALHEYNPMQEHNNLKELLRSIQGSSIRFIQYEIFACDGISDKAFKESFHHDFKAKDVEIFDRMLQSQTKKLSAIYALKDLYTHKTKFGKEFKAFQFTA